MINRYSYAYAADNAATATRIYLSANSTTDDEIEMVYWLDQVDAEYSEAHTEALELNAVIDAEHVSHLAYDEFDTDCCHCVRRTVIVPQRGTQAAIDAAHSEALAINAVIDLAVQRYPDLPYSVAHPVHRVSLVKLAAPTFCTGNGLPEGWKGVGLRRLVNNSLEAFQIALMLETI